MARRTDRPRQRPAPRSPSPSPRAHHWLWGAGAVAAAVLVYLPALRNGFIWDDPLVLEQLRAIHGLRDLLIPPDVIPHFYYRPLIFLSYLVDHTLGGEAPFWFHVSVVTVHAINTGLVWYLGVRLFGATPAAAAAALLFAVHPIHVESVAWMAGRSDVIAATFLLLSAVLLTRDGARWPAWAAVGSYALALLSKETAVAGSLILPLVDIARRRALRWRLAAALCAVTLGYLLLRRLALGATVTGYATSAPVAEMLRDLAGAVGFYLGKLLLPIDLNAYLPEVPAGATLPVLGVITLAVAVGGIVVAQRSAAPGVQFLIAWFFLTVAPSLIVIIRRSAQAPVADRYLYIPSIAACLLLAPLMTWLSRRRAAWRLPAMVAVVTLSAGFAVLSVQRNRVWADELLFWQDVAAKAPAYALGHRELAQIYMNRDRLDDAEAALQRALHAKSDPEGRVMTLHNLGNLQLRRRRLDEAERSFQEGLKIRQHPYLYYGLGRLAMTRAEQAQARGDDAEVQRQVVLARDHLQQCLALDPDSAKAHVLLGQVLYALKDRAGARHHLERALQLGARGSIAEVAQQYLKMVGS